MFHLPAELVELVFDEIDAYLDLKTLTLVSRAFVASGQCRLFRSMTLTTDTIVGLTNALSQSPHFGTYVHDLYLNLHVRPDDIQSALAQAIRPLSKVRRVTISALRGEPWLFWSWDGCSKDLKSALISLFSLPTMRSLALVRCCGVPAALVSHAITCYEEVILQVADLDVAKSKINFKKTRGTTPLKHLVLLDYSPAATPDVHVVLLRAEAKAASAHLQHLEITLPTPLQARDGLRIVAEYASSLQKLTVKFYRDAFHETSSRALTQIDLPTLPQLRSLDLRASIPSFIRNCMPDPLLLLIAGLPSLTPKLEFLNIDLTAIAANVPSAPDPALAADEGLMRLHVSHLREVHFMVAFASGTSYSLPHKQRVRSKIQEILPHANAAGILSFPENIPNRPTY
ncbi:hypothetical protein C8R45DRAFT_637895 [Mycena sanguinolenta]|nr:hypothetical protein C8R45DRAFT_637895 [Mycena sanguinolenta]